jgi:hypothetical protein
VTALEPAEQTIAASDFCPGQFIDRKSGQPNMANLRFGCEWLIRKGLDPVANIDQIYVIGGKVTAMAELQRVLIRRAGFDLEVVESDDDHATVQIRRLPVGPGIPLDAYPWRQATVTMAEATRAKWPERNPSYQLMPARMLVARACTRAISLYAPEASRLAGLEEGGTNSTTDIAPSRSEDGREERIAPAGRDDWHTIPPRVEPRVAPERIDHLEGQIRALSLADRDGLRSIAKALHMPNLRGPLFTLRDAALLHRLIAELGGPEIEDDETGDYPEDDPGRPFLEEEE